MSISSVTPAARMELIQQKAYELYVQRGKTPGHEVEDWLTAEKLVDRDLRSESTGQRSAFANRPAPALASSSGQSSRR
jgi:hypothetical protein